ncbi:BC1872 family protein [Paenibacillus sp. FSL L8-0708]|uniref:BC1872 family protein n=1 Tax=Paenibacillus sp. FSL L8-0708 TaxID=2975311 RepID=UPI0030FBBF3E
MTLTREELLAMEPGNELDIEIAVTVMGRERDKFRSGWIRLGDLSTYPKQYSKDISAAWEVEERIKVLRLHTGYVSCIKQVLVGTGEYVGMFDYIHATAEQRCKAALLAVLNL